MPVSKLQRRMAGGFERLIERAIDGRDRIPAEGMTLAAYAEATLYDVAEPLIGEALKILHGRKIVFVRRKQGAARIHATRPAKGDGTNPSRTPLGLLLAAVAPHVPALANAERARDDARKADAWDAHGQADEAVRVQAWRIIALCRRHAERGLPVAEIRAALHTAFAQDAMAALAFHEPRLQAGSGAGTLAVTALPSERKRAPKGAGVEAKALHIIERGGERGASKSDLLRALRPRVTTDALARTLTSLCASGRVASGTLRMQPKGPPSLRYFLATHGLPKVDARGVVVVDAP